MTKRKRLNLILTVAALLGPPSLYLGCIMLFFPEGCRSNAAACFWGYAAVAVLLVFPPLGTAATLALLVVNRKRLKVLGWLGLLLLLILNIFHFFPVNRFAAPYFRPMTYSLPYQGRLIGQEKVYCHVAGERVLSVGSRNRYLLELRFKMCDVADDDIAGLSGNPYIKEISLIDCPNVTDNVVQILARVPRLKKITIGENPQLRDPDFSALAGLRKLTSLDLTGNENLSEESLKSLASLRQLKELRLCLAPPANPEIVDLLKRKLPECRIAWVKPERKPSSDEGSAPPEPAELKTEEQAP